MNVEDDETPEPVIKTPAVKKPKTLIQQVLGPIQKFLGLATVEEEQGIRVLRSNDQQFNNEQKFVTNFISTTKYNKYTFLIVNLWEQFSRLANAYFLFIFILELIPWISALHWWITLLPLTFVLSVTAIKDAVDDIARWRSDKDINNRTTHQLQDQDAGFTEILWHKLQVGDIVRLENNEPVPADILLLSSSAPNGLCYIETAELDGETNLKVRQSLAETEVLNDDLNALGDFLARVECEPPNNRLDKFVGKLIIESMTQQDRSDEIAYSLDNESLLLRGMVLKNTKWVTGLVIFTGHQSKLMMNSGKPTLKRTNIDHLLNRIVYYILGLLLGLCVACGLGAFIWETIRGKYFEAYAPYQGFLDTPIIIALMRIPSYIIVLNTLVPISLYVSVELIRLGQSQFINWDLKMYHNDTDTPARARSTALNEELGQIKYIFSDKTGTLTQNVMVFLKGSINSVPYGDADEDSTPAVTKKKVDFGWNKYADPKFEYTDESLLKAVQSGEEEVDKYFKVLSLCHTVMSSEEDGVLTYQAQSPDEEALLTAARNFGYVFKTRTQKTITLDLMGTEETYEVLALLDFDNVRKRMSVILRCPDDKIVIYCKGADTTVIPLLAPDKHQDKLEATLTHMNDFAKEGLRTLIIATKEIPLDFFANWERIFDEAKLSMDDREGEVNAAYEMIEKDLDLVGATAIEDKLQDGVPDTIANLARASIKIWVLTGDKQETAINIGYSCKLIRQNMEVLILEGEDKDEVREDLKELEYRIKDARKLAKKSALDPEFALVVTGAVLHFALDPLLKPQFLDLALECAAVVCCRVTPLQKALVVRMVKEYKEDPLDNNITLSIGDGANDVSMIREAHIGVGISGKEGRQAVLASDFSFAQFRFLERLILVHGHWSYIRMCKFLRYFFFKNFAFTLVQLFYAPFCGFTAQTIFDPLYITLYNVVFTSFPVMLVGVLDQELSSENAPPEVYEVGQLNQMFNKQAFALAGFHGFTVAAGCLFIPYMVFKNSVNEDGLDQQSMYFIGTAIAGIVTIVVNFQVALETTLWTVFNHILTWGSIASWFVLFLILCTPTAFQISPENFSYFDGIYRVLDARTWWLTMFLTCVVCLFPFIGYRLYVILTQPTLLQEVVYNIEKKKVSKLTTLTKAVKAPIKEMVEHMPHLHGHKGGVPVFLTKRQTTRTNLRPQSATTRHGYAFSGPEGMGTKLTGGEAFNKVHRTDREVKASMIVDVDGDDVPPLPVPTIRPRSGSIRGSRKQPGPVITVD